jgi:hypothetical protein
MKRTYTLAQAKSALKLVAAIAREFAERRDEARILRRQRRDLEAARTPEGLRSELAELDARIAEHDEGMLGCRRELEGLSLAILQQQPLTLHFPGTSRSGPVVFCWVEGDESLGYGHAPGEEEDPRRPLRLKSA